MSDKGISVITCTGGRPEALSLCLQWLQRQTFTGDIQHILVNDVDDPFPLPANCYPIWLYPKWKPGQNTLARNLMAGLEKASHDIVVFCEDDDYYSPDYLEFMHKIMTEKDTMMAGENTSYYYHAPSSRYKIIRNKRHASLGQTAIRREVIPTLLKTCNSSVNIDIRAWGKINGHKLLFDSKDERKLVVGMKGLPGRFGIGVGHRLGFCNQPDDNWEVLRAWIGDDFLHYKNFLTSKAA